MNPYQQYEQQKADWLRDHPHATPEQIEQAFQRIAERLGL